MKEFMHDNLSLMRVAESSPKENTRGKGEIACYEQFLIFPVMFSNHFYSRHIKPRASLGKGYTLSDKMTTVDAHNEK